MSSNIQNYIRPTGNKSRAEINRILEALQDLFAAPIEEEAVHERISLTPHRKKKTMSTTLGSSIDESQTETLQNETETMLRSKPTQVKSYSLTHSDVGTPTYSVSGTKYGGRITFDGSSSITINDNSILDVTDEITLTGYFYLPGTSSGNLTQFLISKDVYTLEIQPHVLGANTIRGSVKIGGTYYNTVDTWNEITLTWKSPNIKLYINGTLTDTNTSATGTLDTNSDPLEIGDGTEVVATSTTVTTTSTETSPTNSTSIPIIVTFSDSSFSGFTSSDVVIGSGSVSSFVDNNPIFTFNVAPSSDGTITVDVPSSSAFDRNANGSSAAVQFSIISDTTPPSVPIIIAYTPDPTLVNPITLSGTGENGATVTLTSSVDGAMGTTVVSGGLWSLTTPSLTIGTHSMTATQTDTAGNISSISLSESITINATYLGLEAGDTILKEDGDRLIISHPLINHMVMESGESLLLESGDKLTTE
jgi:hypothetical protein